MINSSARQSDEIFRQAALQISQVTWRVIKKYATDTCRKKHRLIGAGIISAATQSMFINYSYRMADSDKQDV